MMLRLIIFLYICANQHTVQLLLQSSLKTGFSLLTIMPKKKLLPSRLRGLSKYSDCPEYLFAVAIKSRFHRHMSPAGLVVLDKWLSELKEGSNVIPLRFFRERFMSVMNVPFRLYTVKMSNRNYSFPGPFLRQSEQERFLLKMFSRVVGKRKEEALLGRIFLELRDYLSGQSASLMVQQLENFIAQGFENRAYVHYRWMLRR